jgi:hypothetical protein
MKNRLLLCLLAVPAFLCGMEKEKNVVNAPTNKKDKDETYMLRVSFAEAFRGRSFDHLGIGKVAFQDIDKSKTHEISYSEANAILYKFTKKIAMIAKNKDSKKFDYEINLWREKKLPFDRATSRQKYLGEIIAMGTFYEPQVPEIRINRALYLTAWATGNGEKIKEASNFPIYNEKEEFLTLPEVFNEIIK